MTMETHTFFMNRKPFSVELEWEQEDVEEIIQQLSAYDYGLTTL